VAGNAARSVVGALNGLLRSGNWSAPPLRPSPMAREDKECRSFAPYAPAESAAGSAAVACRNNVVHAFQFSGCAAFTSRITFSACSIQVRLLPTDELAPRARLQESRDLDQRPVHLSKEAVFHVLRDVAEMDVHVFHLTGVDPLARLGVRLIGEPQVDATGQGQRAVQFGPGGSAVKMLTDICRRAGVRPKCGAPKTSGRLLDNRSR